MVTLYCVVVGVAGSAFPVDIDENKSVGHLKYAIKEKNASTITCDAKNLQLFLAKAGGNAWLSSLTEDVKKLKKGEKTALVKSLTQEEKELQGEDPISECLEGMDPPKVKQIHVLVVVPEQDGTISNDMSAVTTPLTVEQVEMSMNKVLRERDEKASAYSFSDLNTAMEERIVKKMRLTENIPDVKEPVDTSIAGYSWIPKIVESEESQRAGYMAYLQQHLKTLIDRGDFLLDDIAGDKSVLNIVDPRLPFAMKGTADVLLINRTAKNPLIKLAGVSLVIELKKKVEPGHVPQAIGQLVSCSMKAPLNCYPLSLLTDLNDHWHFSWFSDKHVLTQLTLRYPKNAFRFIEAAVLRRTESAPPPPSFMPGSFKTIKVDDFLPQPVDARAEEMMERYELMADVVEPEFLMARRMDYARQLVQSMPMYSYMYT
ncbi:Crinkler (CRN) family protein [Phytophthora infestans T30-4]|uniref:Crinkler (CRN) family protein n=1 Tax=Phytophthora infestans (strain T30-4) TaxID=403677 RepID=D0P0M0_PHYIT|nr:Crinkler (CRN) family protein [Phytophthora infestans T30-4]EEY52986.1 Crinkler (CRN) family protein [Phytophthora infestans T30-4]|eukprot:XP_002896158.1 Crinkler (CRN) family protein [Phytophthora infestans T30-4]